MEQKINIAELLKDCPKGMKLYSPIFGEVYLDKIRPHLAIVVTTDKEQGDFKEEFLYDGRYGMNGECMLFPSKGKTSWEGFFPPCKFKDGDILTNNRGSICIYKGSMYYNKKLADFYCGYRIIDYAFVLKEFTDEHFGYINEYRLATEEEKQKLFQTIKDNGYKWNAKTKTLEKLINPKFKVGDIVRSKNCIDAGNFIIVGVEENSYSINIKNYCIEFKDQDNYELVPNNLKKLVQPKFKVGDRIRHKNDKTIITVTGTKDDFYFIQFYNIRRNDYQNEKVLFKEQDNYELVTNKFDITTLKPFDKVLVRCGNEGSWSPQFFAKYRLNSKFPFVCTYNSWSQCIPYDGNEHLLDTTNDCDEFYKTWE